MTGAQSDGTYLGGGEHAHNLLIQLLCEFGILAPILVIVLGIRWWLGFIRAPWTTAHWWIAAILLILTTHSQLEYPLWYAFFLGIAALALGLGSPQAYALQLKSRWLIGLILAFAAATMASLFIDYRQLEDTLNARHRTTDGQPPSAQARLDALSRLHRESLFAHYVPLSYAFQLEVNREALADKIAVCQQAIRFSPVDLVTYKLAWLLALDGRIDEARLALKRALATHPAYAPAATEQLAVLIGPYPELSWLAAEIPAPPR